MKPMTTTPAAESEQLTVEQIAERIAKQYTPPYESTARSGLRRAILSALRNEREACARIEFATVIPVGGDYSVAIGTSKSGVGIRLFESLKDAKAMCEAINTNVAAAIRGRTE